MTVLDMASLTARQQDVLGQVAVGQDQGHPPRTLKALERKGLIVACDSVTIGHPPVKVTRYEVPIHVHIQWCEWCSRQVDDEARSRRD